MHSNNQSPHIHIIALNNGKLNIFGYGSLCWHPGYDGVLSLASITQEEDDDNETIANSSRKVTTKAGRAIGYQRCWSQRSADHRGTTSFNGIVCTLLSDDEVDTLLHESDRDDGISNNDKKKERDASPRPTF